jgi:homoserine acetyltransferase
VRLEGWESVDKIERRNAGLPFPKYWYKGEYSNGQDHDGMHITEQLGRLTIMQRSKAAEAYGNLYAGVDSRFECNSRLRAFADRCCSANSGKTSSPRRVATP